MRTLVNVMIFYIFILSCKNVNKNTSIEAIQNPAISCDGNACQGTYIGAEFINGADTAHQFSNKMSAAVGDKLKEFYANAQYSKVDFDKILMTTDGMGSGTVKFKLLIPFARVKDPCQAFTSFDHVGGWNHRPDLEKRKQELNSALLVGDSLNISALKTTIEGLEEHWIQWRNKDLQSNCIQ